MKMQKHLLVLAAGLLCAGVHAMEETKFEVLAKLLVNGVKVGKWEKTSKFANNGVVQVNYNDKKKAWFWLNVRVVDGMPELSTTLMFPEEPEPYKGILSQATADLYERQVAWGQLTCFEEQSRDEMTVARLKICVRKLIEEEQADLKAGNLKKRRLDELNESAMSESNES